MCPQETFQSRARLIRLRQNGAGEAQISGASPAAQGRIGGGKLMLLGSAQITSCPPPFREMLREQGAVGDRGPSGEERTTMVPGRPDRLVPPAVARKQE